MSEPIDPIAVRAIVQETLRAQEARRGPSDLRIIPGVVMSASGPDLVVQGDDEPGVDKSATRTSTSQTAGTRVLLFMVPPSGIFAIGVIPT